MHRNSPTADSTSNYQVIFDNALPCSPYSSRGLGSNPSPMNGQCSLATPGSGSGSGSCSTARRVRASSQLLVSLTCGKVYSPNPLTFPSIFAAIPGKRYRFWERTACPANVRDAFGLSNAGRTTHGAVYSISSTPRRFKASRFIGITIWSISSWSGRGVNAIFASGFTDTGSFLVGCDGLHGVRAVLIGEDPITFLGLTQVRYASL
jgi:hypothetical protein